MPDSSAIHSGYERLIGYRLTAWREGHAEVELELGPQHMNMSGAPHGGVLATLIDTACGFAGCYSPDPARPRRAVTLSLTTHFVGGAKAGSRITAVARQTGGGRNIFFTTAEVRDETGALIAEGAGVFRYRGDGAAAGGQRAGGGDAA